MYENINNKKKIVLVGVITKIFHQYRMQWILWTESHCVVLANQKIYYTFQSVSLKERGSKRFFESIAIQHIESTAKQKETGFFSVCLFHGVVACVIFFSLIVLVLFPFRCSIVSPLHVRISSDMNFPPDVTAFDCVYETAYYQSIFMWLRPLKTWTERIAHKERKLYVWIRQAEQKERMKKKSFFRSYRSWNEFGCSLEAWTCATRVSTGRRNSDTEKEWKEIKFTLRWN